VKEIISYTASELEKDNRVSDAILVFDLVDEYNEVFRILINYLGRMLIPNQSYDRDRKLLISFTDQIYRSYTQSGILSQIDTRKRTTLQTLCNLVSFFSLFYGEEYVEALKYMIKLDLIPFHRMDIDPLAYSFKLLDSNIQHNFSQIALTTMQCLYNVFERTGNTAFISPWSKEELREFARFLILFVSRISIGNYTLPGDVCAALSRLEVRFDI